MRWLRSWPRVAPGDRAWVKDHLELFIMDSYDYSRLGCYRDNLIVIEWDVAIDPPDAEEFEARCLEAPELVRVAPYRLHDELGTRWAHRIAPGPDPKQERWVLGPADPSCDYFGFGLIYLPHEIVRAFLEAPAPERGRPPWAEHYQDRRLTDQTFSTWHRWRGPGVRVPIEWDLPAVHLH